jgi:hypothetical protein
MTSKKYTVSALSVIPATLIESVSRMHAAALRLGIQNGERTDCTKGAEPVPDRRRRREGMPPPG